MLSCDVSLVNWLGVNVLALVVGTSTSRSKVNGKKDLDLVELDSEFGHLPWAQGLVESLGTSTSAGGVGHKVGSHGGWDADLGGWGWVRGPRKRQTLTKNQNPNVFLKP